jgi:hypothetical protein
MVERNTCDADMPWQHTRIVIVVLRRSSTANSLPAATTASVLRMIGRMP